jgi:quercetin dioxygenase-like cupin family protein
LIRIKAPGVRGGYDRGMDKSTLLPANEARELKLGDAIRTAPAGIVSRTVLRSDAIRVVLFAFAEGQELTPHSSSRRALVHILDGGCDFLFAGEWRRLEAGTFLHMPPNHPHAVRASQGPFTMLLTLAAEAGSAED